MDISSPPPPASLLPPSLLQSFFGKDRKYAIVDGKGVPSCQYPDGVTEMGECMIQDIYDCEGQFVGVHLTQTYQRRDKRNNEEIIHSNTMFYSDGRVSSLGSSGSVKEGTFHISSQCPSNPSPSSSPRLTLIMDTTGYSQYLGKRTPILTTLTKNPQGWSFQKFSLSEEEEDTEQSTTSRMPYYTCRYVEL